MSGMDVPSGIIMDVSGRAMSVAEVEAASKHVDVVGGFNNVHHLARGSGAPTASQNGKSFPGRGHKCGRAVKPQMLDEDNYTPSQKAFFAAMRRNGKKESVEEEVSTIVVNRHGLCGCKKVALSGTETVLDLFVYDGFPATECGFELFISPTMKRLDRTRTIRSYGIKDGANIYLLPVNKPKKFEPLEESLKKIRVMEYQQMLLDGIVISAACEEYELTVDSTDDEGLDSDSTDDEV